MLAPTLSSVCCRRRLLFHGRRVPQAAAAAPGCPDAAPLGCLPRVYPRERTAASKQKKVFDEGRQDGGTAGNRQVRRGADEEEEERRPRTVSLGSGSTQEWAATELCGTGGGVYKQSFTELLRPSLSGNEGDGHVNLSFGLSTGRSSTPSRTILVHPHPDDDGRQLTGVNRSSKTRVLARDTRGADPNSSTQQARASSLSRAAQARPHWMMSPSPLSAASEVARRRGGSVDAGMDFFDVGDDRDGREVWKEHRQELWAWREESIPRGVERLCVGEREKETDDPPVEADDDDEDDNDGEGGEGGDGYVSLSLQSDMALKGGKSKSSGRNGRPRAKRGAGREDDDEGSTRGSSQTTGTPAGFGKRKRTRQQTFDALTECMEKHGALMASTMESASKRQCSIQVRQCEALEAQVEVQRKHYAASDEAMSGRVDRLCVVQLWDVGNESVGGFPF
ncbi:hypothetical protein CBR_g53929 [Chara braunii]|uniref:Uncharacterized protein n=1 Tax=Chara braunii TaxID=69332 RepID=A0A388MBE3_CHABU|nr:hypothetical protein CBR_g53929 [Chara braunii]|eukprot:GBG91870.1 hypothetical protein CBR_g53929 [Chara braunii]